MIWTAINAKKKIKLSDGIARSRWSKIDFLRELAIVKGRNILAGRDTNCRKVPREEMK